jgi:hypothetical protein
MACPTKKVANVGFFSRPSLTPEVTVLAAKANPVRVAHREIEAEDSAIAPSPMSAFGIFNTFISAITS